MSWVCRHLEGASVPLRVGTGADPVASAWRRPSNGGAHGAVRNSHSRMRDRRYRCL